MSQKLRDRTPADFRSDRDAFARGAEQDAAFAMKEGRLVATLGATGRTISGAYELIREAAEWWLTGTALCEADLDAEEFHLRSLPRTPGVTVALSMVAEERGRRYAYRNGVPRS